MIALLPVFLLLCIAVKISSGGPVFYTQLRVGRWGRPFRVIKFRTMRVGAEKEGTITSAGDDRITAVGRALRRFKLDELPQLWNVLIGKMSFVGPRPDVPAMPTTLPAKPGKSSNSARASPALRRSISGTRRNFSRMSLTLRNIMTR